MNTTSVTEAHRNILAKKLADGARNAAGVIETIHRDVPKDQIAMGGHLKFAPSNQGMGIIVHVGKSDAYTPTSYALSQVASRASMPYEYLGRLAGGDEWQRELAADVLTRSYSHADGRFLVRSVKGTMRGLLSDKYRRLDSRPLIDALVAEADAVGAVPIDGSVTETRVALKIVLPEIMEPVPGELMVFGGEWCNSDFGNGVHGFRAFGLRVTCLNGMTMENVLKQVHIGGKLSDDIEFSAKTHRLDTDTSISALRDVIRGQLSPVGLGRTVDRIRAAHSKEFTTAQLSAAIRNLPKSDAKSVVDAYESQDVLNLPPGNTAWRASNAVSWIARHTEDAEKRLDMERLAGQLAA